MRVRVADTPERKYSSRIGGFMLSSLCTFLQAWVHVNEYGESGPRIAHEKRSLDDDRFNTCLFHNHIQSVRHRRATGRRYHIRGISRAPCPRCHRSQTVIAERAHLRRRGSTTRPASSCVRAEIPHPRSRPRVMPQGQSFTNYRCRASTSARLSQRLASGAIC